MKPTEGLPMIITLRLMMSLRKKGITQRDLADQTHINEGTLSRIINGRVYPNFRQFFSLLDALGLQMYLTDDPMKSPNKKNPLTSNPYE